MISLKISNFFVSLFEKRKIPDVYSKIQYWENEVTLYTKGENDNSISPSHKLYSVSLIPDYLKLECINPLAFKEKTRNQNNLGYALLLKEEFDIDTFLKTQFKSNYRKIKKRHSRLESCFNIDYKFFYGNIAKEEYLFLMNRLRTMIVRRFRQRNDKNQKLNEWEELVAVTHGQINENKASLFVIYEGDEPINISLNYHFDKIMFGAISSYDIDYSKFGLGSIEKVKLLEWCLANNYKILEFGYGDLTFKRIWSNYIYNFKYQVIFNRKSWVAIVLAQIELLKLSVKEYLKSKKIDVYFRRIKTLQLWGRNKEIFNKAVEYDRTVLTSHEGIGTLQKVNYEYENHFSLKTIVNDFLYATVEHKKSIVVQKVLDEPNTFLISGRKNIQKITFRI